MDQNAWELGKNYPTEVGIYGHPKPGSGRTDGRPRETMTPAQRETAVKRGREQGEIHRKMREQLQAKASSESKHKPLTPLATMAALAKVFPEKRGRRRGSRNHHGHDARASRRDSGSQRIFRPSRLGPRLGTRLQHRRQTCLAASPRARRPWRGGLALRYSRFVDGGQVQNSRHVRDLQQRPIPDFKSWSPRHVAPAGDGGAI